MDFLTSNQKHEFGYLLNKQNEKIGFFQQATKNVNVVTC